MVCPFARLREEGADRPRLYSRLGAERERRVRGEYERRVFLRYAMENLYRKSS